MNAVLLLLRQDNEWTGWIWFILFIAFPLLSKILKGLKKDETKVEAGESPLERRRRLRAEQARAEVGGEDLWKRLARGDELAVPAPAPPARPREAFEPSVPELSLESEQAPAPLAMLGEVVEPSEAPEASLERVEEPLPLAALATPVALAPVQFEATPREPRQSFRLARGEVRRAIVLSEILGPPVSERSLRA